MFLYCYLFTILLLDMSIKKKKPKHSYLIFMIIFFICFILLYKLKPIIIEENFHLNYIFL